jgi:hypothetical protein
MKKSKKVKVNFHVYHSMKARVEKNKDSQICNLETIWTRRIACMKEKRDACRILVRESKGKRYIQVHLDVNVSIT